MSSSMSVRAFGIATFAAFLMAAGNTSAATLQISVAGLDIEYNESGGTATIVDAGDPDSLISADFVIQGSGPAGPTLTSNLTADLEIPGITPLTLPAVGATDTVGSTGGGFLTLDFGNGDFLSLDLGAASVGFTNNPAPAADVSFGGTVAGITGQSLPYDLIVGDPVAVSFSTQVETLADNGVGGLIDSFTASGTGEIFAQAVPEPSSVGLIALAGLLGTMALGRYRLG